MKKFIAYLGICSCLVAQTTKVGVNAEMPPFEFIENGQIIGFDIDLANELSKRLGFDIKIVEESYTDICKKINSNELDIGISSFGAMTNTQQTAITQFHIMNQVFCL